MRILQPGFLEVSAPRGASRHRYPDATLVAILADRDIEEKSRHIIRNFRCIVAVVLEPGFIRERENRKVAFSPGVE